MPTLEISYDAARRAAILSSGTNSLEAWFVQLLRSLRDQRVEVEQREISVALIPWGQLLGARNIVNDFRVTFGITIKADALAERLLREARARISSFETAKTVAPLPEEEVRDRLLAAGFVRTLTPEQLRNVSRIANLQAAATFSVPGAGKTTEALAYYAIRAVHEEPLFVIAPKNALGAWDEQLEECFGARVGSFIRLRGGEETIGSLLQSPAQFMIITYQQLSRDRVPRLVANFVASRSVFVFVDESHRIKGRGITSITVRDLAFLPVGKLVMSGTPMPQAVEDLLPQFEFLYPEIEADATNVVGKVQHIFVRTTKAELGLPEPQRLCAVVPMLPGQRRVYDLLKKEVARQAEVTLRAADRNAFRMLGRSVMRILQVVSNPALLAASWSARPDLLAAALEEGDSPKVEYSCRRARQLVSQGKKVLIWSSFRENVELITTRLSDLGAVFIHGGVDAGDEDEDATREGRIRRFHDEQNCRVMVANPAAAGEGISLHKVCHNAIYVDRTYNAAHYMQSEDRIHRIGTKVAPVIDIVECAESIDQSVAQRLEFKVQQMADALNDHSLGITPKIVAFDEEDESGDDPTLGMNIEDVRSILAIFGARP